MSDRDVIAETIAAHALYYDEFGPHIHVCACGWHVPDELEEEYLDGDVAKFTLAHAAHVAAALREARTVRSVEELDALPVGTVVRELATDGFVLESYHDQIWQETRWLYPGDDDPQDRPGLPARVLFLPSEDGAL